MKDEGGGRKKEGGKRREEREGREEERGEKEKGRRMKICVQLCSFRGVDKE
jgi:hypothetical protein